MLTTTLLPVENVAYGFSFIPSRPRKNNDPERLRLLGKKATFRTPKIPSHILNVRTEFSKSQFLAFS